MTYNQLGHLEQDYLNQDYMSGLVMASGGFQFLAQVVDKTKPHGGQFKAEIVDYGNKEGFQYLSSIVNFPKPFGSQYLSKILDALKANGLEFNSVINALTAHGFQFHIVVDSSSPKGAQFLSGNFGFPMESGAQFLVSIGDQKSLGFEFRVDGYQSYPITGYLDDGYLSEPYLTGYFGPRIPFQFLGDMQVSNKSGFQSLVNIIDKGKTTAEQFQAIIDFQKKYGFQFKAITQGYDIRGAQFQSHIVDYLRLSGFQFLGNLNKEIGYGFQYQVITQVGTGFQFLSTIYNTKNLRILSDLKSRGLTNTNWTCNSTASGDFSPNNLDTDIVEQVWRSENGVKSGIKLTCDVGVNKTVYVDTLAILNHNMSAGANLTFLMSNDPLFVTGVKTVSINSRRYDTYYISEYLPTTGYRYFQLQIDDAQNSLVNYIEIGCIMFGNAEILHGENFTDEVDFEMVDYTDTVQTEGHTNVANSRALKRKLTLNFQSLAYKKRNYGILREVFQTYRTTHKCLWIPTPDVIDMDVVDRLRIFGKLTQIPKERHNNKGGDADYVSFVVDLDEAL